MKNPLLNNFNTLYSTAPFSKIKNNHFKPAFIEAIKIAKEEIDIITNNAEVPTFENTLEELEFSGQILDRISSVFFNLNSAETNDEIQKIAQEVSPMLSEFSNDITLNKQLFKRVQLIYDIKDELNLSPEQHTLLTEKYKSFVRNGANLNETDKIELRKIDAELSKLKLNFGENVLAETQAFELHLIDKKQLKGLPESTIEAAQMVAKQKNKEGWIFTLDYPSYVPFMTYADDRSLRKKMALAFGTKAFQNNKFNNQQIVLDLVKLRYKRATILGYESHSHFVLEERMAESPKNVTTFLDDLLTKAKPAAEKEFENLLNFAKKDKINQLEKWDSAYYSEKLKKELFDLEEEQLKPYFKLENVIQGVFTVSNKLFDLQFEEINTIDKYHEEVKTYKVTDSSGNYIAVLYADFFPRKGKRNGAWMTSFKGQWQKDGENSRP
ncbi:M3 family metallopeptidase, partial [uncultured Lutibacter sp.]|uniref:M3 family metallopeptidase n=1 Tax=uncultured Lutibacter sp. TaxID=437739 RepID=UPI002636EFC8